MYNNLKNGLTSQDKTILNVSIFLYITGVFCFKFVQDVLKNFWNCSSISKLVVLEYVS